MSGIVGIFQLDNAPVDPNLLHRLTNFQSFRGPDAQSEWIDKHVGFGHTLLRTTEESANEHQPLSLNGKTCIVADARVDGRDDLIAKLRAHGRDEMKGACDAELILRAYDVWKDGCLDHLRGDFVFAIWDGPKRRLFCARDHMGVRPLYYSTLGSQIVFSNTLDCIRQHPFVSDKLNHLAIADFLLFEGNQDLATTSFADIQRLPPGHCASWSESGLCVRRYWSLPIDEPIFYKRAEDYVDHFRGLLKVVVGDRLRTNRVAVFMSGGLDSTTLAAAAKDLLGERLGNFELQAFSRTDPLVPNEQTCAALVASRLEIPIHQHEWGARAIDPNWEQDELHTPEPSPTPWQMLAYQNYCDQVASYGRVFLYGEGPDNALHFEWRPYVTRMFQQRRYLRLLQNCLSTLASQRRPPFWGRISRKIRERGGYDQPTPTSFPDWVSPSLESRLELRARWQAFLNPTPSPHPLRPIGYRSLHIPLWQDVFQRHDCAWTKAPLEVRYPFMDLRMLQFLLAVPPLPWCRSKYLIRRAMCGVLPERVLHRPKTGVSCKAIMDRVGRLGLTPFVPAQGLSSYVRVDRVPNNVSEDPWVLGGHLRIRSLNYWLQCSHSKRQDIQQEGPVE